MKSYYSFTHNHVQVWRMRPDGKHEKIFRYNDLPDELRVMTLSYAFETEAADEFTSYNYFVPYGRIVSGPASVRVYKIPLRPLRDLQRALVSRQFFKNVLKARATRTPIQVDIDDDDATCMKAPASLVRPWIELRTCLLQHTLTQLLSESRHLMLEWEYMQLLEMYLSCLVPLMHRIKRIEIFVPMDLFWLPRLPHRDPRKGTGLFWCDLIDRDWNGIADVSEDIWAHVVRLDGNELQMLLRGQIPKRLPAVCAAEYSSWDLQHLKDEFEGYQKAVAKDPMSVFTSEPIDVTIYKKSAMMLTYKVCAVVGGCHEDYARPPTAMMWVTFDGRQWSLRHCEFYEGKES